MVLRMMSPTAPPQPPPSSEHPSFLLPHRHTLGFPEDPLLLGIPQAHPHLLTGPELRGTESDGGGLEVLGERDTGAHVPRMRLDRRSSRILAANDAALGALGFACAAEAEGRRVMDLAERLRKEQWCAAVVEAEMAEGTSALK